MDLQDFIEEKKINRIIFSKNSSNLENIVNKKFKFNNDLSNNIIYFGVYSKEDIDILNSLEENKYILFKNVDVDILLGDKELKEEFDKIDNKYILCNSENIGGRLKYYGYYDYINIKINLVDNELFKSVENKGNSIFINNGINNNKPYYYGKKIIDELVERNPNYNYIYSNELDISYDKMIEIYKKCFIGLRVSNGEGLFLMENEMYSMGIKTINNNSVNGLKWVSVEDIETIIKNEYLKIIDNEKIMKYNFFKKGYEIKKNYNNSNLEYFVNSIQFFNMKDKLIELYNNNISKVKEDNYVINKNKISISIIMSHRNRPDLLLLTLLKLNNSVFNNFEVVIVDDRSEKHLKPNFIDELYFNYPIKLITIENKDIEDIVCSSYVYNLAFKNSIGDIIIIQNSECLHFGDIPNYVSNNFNYDDYLCFPCYSSNTKDINDYIINNEINIIDIDKKLDEKNIDEKYGVNFPRWYQHKDISNRCLHFCTVISRNYFEMIDGFSEEYNNGFCFEDDDLIFKIRNILKLNVISLNTNKNIGVVHMFHGRNKFVNIPSYNGEDYNLLATKEKYLLNENIFNYKKRNNNEISCPKIFHYYWDDFRKFTFMNLYSLKTSKYYHPDYIHIIWCPINIYDKITWNEFCHKEDVEYDNNFINEIKELNVKIIKIDISLFLNIDNEISEIHKSDLFRYKILNTFGGIWSDLDIVYIKKITDVINFDFTNILFKCYNENKKNYYYPIGLLLSNRKNNFYSNLLNIIIIKFFDSNKYQCIGSEMFKILFESKKYLDVILLDETIYMNYIWCNINELFIEYKENIKNLDNTIGFHWFNGSSETKKYLKEIKYNIPEKFKGILFKNNVFELNTYISNNYFTVKYFDIDISEWAYYYKYKLNNYINILKNHNIYVEKINAGKYMTNEFNYNFIHSKKNFFIFDELSYFHILNKYCISDEQNKNKILDFISNSNYLIIFTELFINDKLQTYGCSIFDKQMSILFFKNAKKIIICNTKNIIYLIKNNIYNNVYYYPPIQYNKNLKLLNKNNNKEIDILFYGNIINTFKYRIDYIDKIKTICKNHNKIFLTNQNLFNTEKYELLSKTKIVIHIPSHENLHTFPWAKVVELMNNKVFFIIEENEEMYIKNIENIVIYYKKNNIYDLEKKLIYYLNENEKREEVIEKCYTYIHSKYKYNITDIIIDTLYKKKYYDINNKLKINKFVINNQDKYEYLIKKLNLEICIDSNNIMYYNINSIVDINTCLLIKNNNIIFIFLSKIIDFYLLFEIKKINNLIIITSTNIIFCFCINNNIKCFFYNDNKKDIENKNLI